MGYIVYILFSEKHNKTYVGLTSSLIQRFKSHNELATKGYTIKFRPWKVIYLEVYNSKTEAMTREKWFKTSTFNYKNHILFPNS
ncbi:GIY-YIG nuclease family protein [Flavobacterium sp. UBA6135]|uniref:GIY-YIG nuclease family protein n=1 Tax=Flavobacterium sp. UBA6135 TaxID=1946553 RepID=UPI0025C1B470|nr:GIY-YIG nuclease family protein [Flavobacterium sp. UBA6135]